MDGFALRVLHLFDFGANDIVAAPVFNTPLSTGTPGERNYEQSEPLLVSLLY
jgi:hypothetical protein